MADKDILSIPRADFDEQVAQAAKLVGQVAERLPPLVQLTVEERRSTQGRFRTGEAEALMSVMDAVRMKPELFESLADRDSGGDPDTFEADLLRDRLERAARLAPLAEAIDRLNTQVADTMLHLTGATRPVLFEAYGIAKSVARTDAKLRSAIAPAIDFFSRIGRLAAQARKQKRNG